MYLPYLMLGCAAAALLLLAGVEVGSRTVPSLRGVAPLRWALVCALVAVLLLALRPIAPDWMTLLCANGAILAAILLVYRATAETLAVSPRFYPWGIGIGIAALAGMAWFDYVHPSFLARILIHSGAMMTFAAFTAVLLFRYREPPDDVLSTGSAMRSQTSALAWLQVANGLNHLVRCILTLLFPPANVLHADMIQLGFTFMDMILNVGAACGVIWLAFSVHQRALQREASTDGLTGLFNRRAFEEVLVRALRRAAHDRRPLFVLMLDIDHFKEVNDSLGHAAGDEVIRRVANALRDSMRPSDSLCRFGGEEFLMLLDQADLAQAEEIAGRLRGAIADLRGLPGGIHLTASLGVAGSRPGDSADHLVRRCDDALYRSKRAGRNRVTVDRASDRLMELWKADHLSFLSPGV